jgi:hypothetical protein
MSRPTNAKMSAKLDYPSNNQFTSFGESQKVRYKTFAQTWSKNGFMCQIKGVSPTCLLSGLQIVQPIDIRWKQHNHSDANVVTCAAAAPIVVPNAYKGFSDVTSGNGTDNPAGMNAVKLFDSISIRPNALMRAARSCVISYNGRSFSTRCKQYLSGIERVFMDGSVEEVYGWPHATYPFTNCGNPTRLLNEPGRLQRCKELTSDVYLKSSHYNANVLDDLVMSYNIRSRLFLGPFIADAFPGLMQSLDENRGGSLPYCSNLTIEIQYETNPLIHFFSYPGNDTTNALAVDNPKGNAMAVSGTNCPDLAMMWATVIEDQTHGLQTNANKGQCVALRQPYAEYEFVEPSPLVPIPQQLTVASKQFICYEDIQQIAATQSSAKFSFSNIKVNQISQLYMLYVEASDSSSGDAIGARQPKWKAVGAASNPADGGLV